MSYADRLIAALWYAAINLGFVSDEQVLITWSKDPNSVTYLMSLRLKALEAKRNELGL